LLKMVVLIVKKGRTSPYDGKKVLPWYVGKCKRTV